MGLNFQDQEIVAGWEEIIHTKKYQLMISDVIRTHPEKRSIFVDYSDINSYNTDLAMYFLENPDKCIAKGREVVRTYLPPDWNPDSKINLRITGLPRDAKVDIRLLRSTHIGKLVAVEGLVRKATSVKPRLVKTIFKCERCGTEAVIHQTGMYLKEPMMCANLDGGCNKAGVRFDLVHDRSTHVDTQKIEIQESPEGLRGGAQPERITAFVEDDVSGIITAGNRVIVNGVIRMLEKPDRDKSTVFEMFIDAVSIEFEQHEYDEIAITEEDEERILEMSKDPSLYDKIIMSISPTIYGLDRVKGAIALQLFGGCHKEMDDGTTIRGDIHVLLMGDPGVAKSQLLRYMSMLAPRGIYASGKSASAAGLTAAAVKDDFGDGRWTLEAGALVLADKGLACIDELDKMTSQDRSSLHEAMESQRISVAKAGITATLQCRCSMLAAANPKFGRFEMDGASISSQIELPPALMSRFDLIFVLTDKPHPKNDTEITTHILGVHRRGEAKQLGEDIKVEGVDLGKIKAMTMDIKPYYDIDMMRKYVAYSKRIVPVMTDGAMDVIKNSYLSIRGMGTGKNDSVPITARQLEAYIRLSEASARLRLSQAVEESDAKLASDLIEYYLDKILAPNGGQWDIDVISGTPKVERDKTREIKNIIQAYATSSGLMEEEILSYTAEMGMDEVETRRILRNLLESGELYTPHSGGYKVV